MRIFIRNKTSELNTPSAAPSPPNIIIQTLEVCDFVYDDDVWVVRWKEEKLY